MKKITNKVFYIILTTLLFGNAHLMFSQDADTLDVAPGFETLNIAIQGDTTSSGQAKNPNRVYRLEKNGYYLLNGTITGLPNTPLRIVSAKGDGARPLLISVADADGMAHRAFQPKGDIYLNGIMITNISNLGTKTDDQFMSVYAEGQAARVVLDNVWVEYDGSAPVASWALDQKVYITNCTFRWSYTPTLDFFGRFYDTRGNGADTVFIQNNTFYFNNHDLVRSSQGIIRHLIFDHNTCYQVANEADFERTLDATITNNLFIDWGFEGYKASNPLEDAMIKIDSLRAPEIMADEDRIWNVKNNVYSYTPEIRDFLNSIDSVKLWVWLSSRGQNMINTFPNMVEENNIEEYPGFTDPHPSDKVIVYARHRIETGHTSSGNPDPVTDRNGVSDLQTDPTSFGPVANEYDYTYSTSSQAYTHAMGGFPVGDLNWWPDKKAEWIITDVFQEKNNGTVPNEFTLEQNYPNPFNPTTTISFSIAKDSKVKLSVFDILGREISVLVNKKLSPGNYSFNWDASSLATGTYIYRIEAGNFVSAKKMVLLK